MLHPRKRKPINNMIMMIIIIIIMMIMIIIAISNDSNISDIVIYDCSDNSNSK